MFFATNLYRFKAVFGSYFSLISVSSLIVECMVFGIPYSENEWFSTSATPGYPLSFHVCFIINILRIFKQKSDQIVSPLVSPLVSQATNLRMPHRRSPQGAPGSPQDPPGSPQGPLRVPQGRPRLPPKSHWGPPIYTKLPINRPSGRYLYMILYFYMTFYSIICKFIVL